MTWAPLVAAVLLLAVNAFFVAAEFALIAARRTFLEQRAAEGDRRAVWALASARELSVMLAGAQLGVTVASVALGFVAEPAVAHLLEPVFHGVGLSAAISEGVAFVLGLAIVVVAHMVLGEMVPKNLAIAGPERTALMIAGPLRLYGRVFRPLLRALNGVANGILRVLRIEPADELATAATAEDLASMIGESRDEGFLDQFEEELLSGALHFDSSVATSVMVPRDRIVAAPITTAAEEHRATGCPHRPLPHPAPRRDARPRRRVRPRQGPHRGGALGSQQAAGGPPGAPRADGRGGPPPQRRAGGDAPAPHPHRRS